MRLYQKSIFFIIPIIVLAGCVEVSQPLDAAFRPTGGAEKKMDSDAMKRFQNTNSDAPTVMESAIELSKKYAALSDEMTALKLEKQTLASENSRLKQQAGAMEQELNQAQKELAEANDLLVEMQLELNNWKTDILGFRDEIRKADKAQLETLLKILKVLGGEVKADPSSEHPSQDPTK